MARRRKSPTTAEALITETMGRLAEAWGMRRNLGRCWAVLYLQGQPMTATELCSSLDLSSGAVSMTVQELQRWGVIRQVHRPDERRKLYVAEVDIWRVVSRVLRARELAELDRAVDSLERALIELRRERDEAPPEARPALDGRVRRLEGLLDLIRVVSSMFRLLVATGRLDATVLTSFRLGGEADRRD